MHQEDGFGWLMLCFTSRFYSEGGGAGVGGIGVQDCLVAARERCFVSMGSYSDVGTSLASL